MAVACTPPRDCELSEPIIPMSFKLGAETVVLRRDKVVLHLKPQKPSWQRGGRGNRLSKHELGVCARRQRAPDAIASSGRPGSHLKYFLARVCKILQRFPSVGRTVVRLRENCHPRRRPFEQPGSASFKSCVIMKRRGGKGEGEKKVLVSSTQKMYNIKEKKPI